MEIACVCSSDTPSCYRSFLLVMVSPAVADPHRVVRQAWSRASRFCRPAVSSVASMPPPNQLSDVKNSGPGTGPRAETDLGNRQNLFKSLAKILPDHPIYVPNALECSC